MGLKSFEGSVQHSRISKFVKYRVTTTVRWTFDSIVYLKTLAVLSHDTLTGNAKLGKKINTLFIKRPLSSYDYFILIKRFSQLFCRPDIKLIAYNTILSTADINLSKSYDKTVFNMEINFTLVITRFCYNKGEKGHYWNPTRLFG